MTRVLTSEDPVVRETTGGDAVVTDAPRPRPDKNFDFRPPVAGRSSIGPDAASPKPRTSNPPRPGKVPPKLNRGGPRPKRKVKKDEDGNIFETADGVFSSVWDFFSHVGYRWKLFGRRLKVYGLAWYIRRQYTNAEAESEQLPDNSPEQDAVWEEVHTRCAELVYRNMVSMGGLWVKLGQMISTRADVFPAPIIKQLKLLQDALPPRPFEEVEEALRLSFPTWPFAAVSVEPLATASIAQVHRATLLDGTRVVVKVRHKGIQAVLDQDLDNAQYIVESLAEEKPQLDFRVIFQEWAAETRKETNFRQEAENTETVFWNLRELAAKQIARVPKVIRGYHVPLAQAAEAFSEQEIETLVKRRNDASKLARSATRTRQSTRASTSSRRSSAKSVVTPSTSSDSFTPEGQAPPQQARTVYIPTIPTRSVLVLEFIEGVKPTEREVILRTWGADGNAVMDQISAAFAQQIFVDGIFNGDPHPGNFLIERVEPTTVRSDSAMMTSASCTSAGTSCSGASSSTSTAASGSSDSAIVTTAADMATMANILNVSTTTNSSLRPTVVPVLLDFGLVKRIPTKLRMAFCRLLVAAHEQDISALLCALGELGVGEQASLARPDRALQFVRFAFRDAEPEKSFDEQKSEWTPEDHDDVEDTFSDIEEEEDEEDEEDLQGSPTKGTNEVVKNKDLKTSSSSTTTPTSAAADQETTTAADDAANDASAEAEPEVDESKKLSDEAIKAAGGVMFLLRVISCLRGISVSLGVGHSYLHSMAPFARSALRRFYQDDADETEDEDEKKLRLEFSPTPTMIGNKKVQVLNDPQTVLIEKLVYKLTELRDQDLVCGLQMCVFKKNVKVIDFAFGELGRVDPRPYKRTTLVNAFSCGKILPVLLIHIFVDRGWIDSLDDFVADYWPAFSKNGKGKITIRDALEHKTGLARAFPTKFSKGLQQGKAEKAKKKRFGQSQTEEEKAKKKVPSDKGRSIRAICDFAVMKKWIASAKPDPEQKNSENYHVLTHGWILAGLAEEVYNRKVLKLGEEQLEQAFTARRSTVAATATSTVKKSEEDTSGPKSGTKRSSQNNKLDVRKSKSRSSKTGVSPTRDDTSSSATSSASSCSPGKRKSSVSVTTDKNNLVQGYADYSFLASEFILKPLGIEKEAKVTLGDGLGAATCGIGETRTGLLGLKNVATIGVPGKMLGGSTDLFGSMSGSSAASSSTSSTTTSTSTTTSSTTTSSTTSPEPTREQMQSLRGSLWMDPRAFNDPCVRNAIVPAANTHFSARALAVLYNELLQHAQGKSTRLFSADYWTRIQNGVRDDAVSWNMSEEELEKKKAMFFGYLQMMAGAAGTQPGQAGEQNSNSTSGGSLQMAQSILQNNAAGSTTTSTVPNPNALRPLLERFLGAAQSSTTSEGEATSNDSTATTTAKVDKDAQLQSLLEKYLKRRSYPLGIRRLAEQDDNDASHFAYGYPGLFTNAAFACPEDDLSVAVLVNQVDFEAAATHAVLEIVSQEEGFRGVRYGISATGNRVGGNLGS